MAHLPRRRAPAAAAVVVAVLVAVAALVGCGDDARAPLADGEATTEGATTLDPARGPPGTEIADGLVVPEGAHRLGAAISMPVEHLYDGQLVREPQTTSVVLGVDGDPFAVFDDLVAQARAAGVDLPGSAGACLWDVPPPPESIASLAPVAAPLPDEPIDGVMCEALATADGRSIHLVLHGDVSSPVLVTIALRDGVDVPDARLGAAEETRANRRALVGDTPATRAEEPATFLDAGDPVPADASLALPDLPTAEDATDPGDPLLPTTLCRSERDAGDLTVPEGARVLARPQTEVPSGAPGDVAVLLTDDAEGALRAVYAEAAGPSGADGEGAFYGEPPAPVELDDGTPVWSVTFGVGAGGDQCSLVASADGTTVLMSVGRG